jgi:hypothetical protein
MNQQFNLLQIPFVPKQSDVVGHIRDVLCNDKLLMDCANDYAIRMCSEAGQWDEEKADEEGYLDEHILYWTLLNSFMCSMVSLAIGSMDGSATKYQNEFSPPYKG